MKLNSTKHGSSQALKNMAAEALTEEVGLSAHVLHGDLRPDFLPTNSRLLCYLDAALAGLHVLAT